VLDHQESARRWRGFVCPDCRFVFRVARDHDGSGLVCPSCHRLLRLPGENDVPPPLLVEQLIRTEGDPIKATEENRNVRRKRKRKRRSGESHAWEENERRIRKGDRRHGVLTLVTGLVLLMAILGMVIFTTMENPGDSHNADADAREGFPISSNGLDLPPLTTNPELASDSDPISDQRDNAQFLSDAHPVAKAFLGATTVEELLEIVDRPDVVAERIKRDHPDGTIEPLGLGDYSRFSQVRHIGPYGIVPLRTGDFHVRIMTFRVYPEELKVDWESWVGWSETTWDDFIAQRPTQASVFRANLEAVEYYNFNFSDDRKWQSYRLLSPDGEHSLYGYVERDSQAHIGLRSVLEQGFSQVMIELQYAENAATSDQVEITRLIAENWIDPERVNEP